MRSTPPSRSREVAAALASARIGFASTLAAWPVLAGRALFYALILVVLSALWDRVAAERVAGALALPRGGLALYVGVTEWVTFSVAAVHLRLEDDIRQGLLEPHLLRPKVYLVQRVAEALGASFARFLAVGVVGLALLAASGRAGPPATALPAVAALALMGMVVGVLLLAVTGLAAFWVRRVLPPYLIVQKLTFLLGGLFAPVALYPAWLRRVAEASPFGAHLAFAGQAAIGADATYLVRAVALQLFWIAALGGLAALVWRAGLARVLRGRVMAGVISTYAVQARAAIRTAFSDRANFALQAGGMIVNDGFLLVMWFMFFAGFRSVGGWRLGDVALLMGLMMTIVGLSGTLFGGYRDMAAAILRGELDALLTQPKPVLPRLLAREAIASAFGDLVVGLGLLVTVAGLDAQRAPLAVLGLICGTTIYVSASAAFASLAFWIAGARSFARDLTDFMLLFCTYPGSIFSGASKLIAYTVLPAGFVVMVPVRLIQSPSWGDAAIMALSALGYALIAWAAFAVGLRRYRRGDAPMA